MARLGDYELEGEIGRGAMGSVFRARHVLTGAIRAVKVLGSAGDPELLVRFQREAEGLARVGGNVAVPVHEVGLDRGRRFFVMDLLAGGSLADRLKSAPRLDWREAVDLLAKLARSVARCHSAGIVHRDLKPSNVLFDAAGSPRLADFGSARDLGASTLTEAGKTPGTPAYMAPEQLDGQRGDARSDVYSLAVLLHELVAGALPHAGSTWRELLVAAHKGLERPIAAQVAAPLELDRILARALAPDPAGRTPSAEALALDLEALLAGEPSTSPAHARVGALVGVPLALVLVAGAIALAVTHHSNPDLPESGSGGPAGSPRPSPDPQDRAALEDRLRAGGLRDGELETVASTPGGAEILAHLARDAVVLPLDRVRAALAGAPGRSRGPLCVLEAVATITSESDSSAIRSAIAALRTAPREERLASELRGSLESVRRVLSQLETSLPRGFDKDELTSLAVLKDHPRLLGWAIAPLCAESRLDVLGAALGGRSAALGDLLASTPCLGENLDALPAPIAHAYLVFNIRNWTAMVHKPPSPPVTQDQLRSDQKRLRSAGDTLLAAHAVFLERQLLRREGMDPEVLIRERDFLDGQLAPFLARTTDPTNEERFARRLSWEATKRWRRTLSRFASRGPGRKRTSSDGSRPPRSSSRSCARGPPGTSIACTRRSGLTTSSWSAPRSARA